MQIYEIDPLQDPRWAAFVETRQDSSVFHTVRWLKALRRSYGYAPLAVTTSGPGKPLENGLVACRIHSWLTGARIVSLPFSDHCQPLDNGRGSLFEMLSFIRAQSRGLRYVEVRPLSVDSELARDACLAESESFCFHALDLRPRLDEIHARFHKNSIQQTIQRAQRQGLTIETGRSESLLDRFYGLFLFTRRRHQLPPQPVSWFKNLVQSFGDLATIRIAYKGDKPIASIFTLAHGNTVVYKYGCSDSQFNSLGGTPYLLWDAIKEAKHNGAEKFDFGRSDWDQSGLIQFKDRWGASRFPLTYYRYPVIEKVSDGKLGQKGGSVRKVFTILPDFCLQAVGRALYRHVG